MKIGLVLEKFDPTRGGLEHWTWQFANRLVGAGHEVHVIAFEFSSDVLPKGIIPHRLEMPKSRLGRAALLAEALPPLNLDITHDMGIGWSADVIHPHGGSTKALWEHNLLRIPKWRQIRFWREKRYRELEEIERRQLANAKAKIIAVSQMVSQHFQSLHRVPAGRIRVIYNGVEVETFTPANREKFRGQTRRELGATDEVLFLMLAHNLLLKNADAAIRATAKLAAKGARVRLVMAGGKRPDRFIQLADKLNVTHLVSFPGLVDPIPFYAAADVFLHPTWYDPCSLVTLEASACGLPVITTRFNGASEFMSDGEEGLLLSNPADIDALVSQMQTMFDSSIREKMGAAGRALALQHTFEKQTQEFLQLYDDILSARHS